MESPKRKMLKQNDYLRHKLFRKIKRRRKALAELELEVATKLLKRKLKLPKFDTGDDTGRGIVYVDRDRLGVDQDGNVLDAGQPVGDGTIRLPLVMITPLKSGSRYFDGNWSKDFINMAPGIGDAMDVGQVVDDASNLRYLQAGIGAGLLLLPNFIERPIKYFSKPIKRFIKNNFGSLSKNNFVSLLDWSPNSWFSYRHDGNYDINDAIELLSHKKEYEEIERLSKINGTWLKNADGTVFNGDPREWVMLNSKNAKWLNTNDPFFHGTRGDVPYDPKYNEEVWGANKLEIAATYHNRKNNLSEIDKLYYPIDANVKSVDAKNRYWGDIDFRGQRLTTDMIKDLLFSEGANVVKIRNVLDLGPENLLPIINSGFQYGDDYIIKNGIPRKSILGNNGAINKFDRNVYKSIIPIGAAIGSGYIYSENK